MKHLKIKNRTGSVLFFVFCTTSSCKCEVCQEWLTCETTPISDRRGATYGRLRVEPFAERVDRFCWRWNCVGACYFDYVPSTVNWAALYEYDQGKDYSVGNGKADLCFTFSADSEVVSSGRRLKYLLLKNHSAEVLYFVYCTNSKCHCDVCQEWLKFETTDVVDWPGWTVGFVRVEPHASKVERFCAEWDCVGCCFFGSRPTSVRKAMLFDYDENENYTIHGGKAALEFAHTTVPDDSPPKREFRFDLPPRHNAHDHAKWKGGLKLAATAGRIALAFGGVPDIGVLGDVAEFVGDLFTDDP